MNLAIDERIFELNANGVKAKAITETLKHEGIKTLRGKVPTYTYVQNRIQALRAKKGFGALTNKATTKANYTASNAPVNMTYQNIASFVLNLLNNPEWADEKKIAVLKAWFA